MAEKIKRKEFALFMDVDPPTMDYALVGDGVTTATTNMNPQTEQETYIHQDSGSTSVTGYQPTMPVEATCMKGDDVWDFVDGLRKIRAVLEDAETTIVEVDLYETGGPTAYPARQNKVSIQIDTFGGDGGASNKLNYTINYIGDPVPGTFNMETATFTAAGGGS
jgi:hypothetical protein